MTQYIKSVELSKVQNRIVRAMVGDSLASYKNWIAMAVSRGDFPYAQKLAKELELRQSLCHVFVPDDMWDWDMHKPLGGRPS